MDDKFKSNSVGLSSPPIQASQVIPSDSTDLDYVSRCVNVAVSGFVRVTTIEGDTVSLFIAAGIAFPVRVTRIWTTGTTATGIVSLC